MKLQTESPRSYRQVARAEATEATAKRILEAFAASVSDRWFDEVTLYEVAARAGVSVRTLIRRFGGKAGLLHGYMDYIRPVARNERTVAPGDVETAITRLIELYERIGDGAIQALAQEARQPVLRPLIEMGQREHRALTEQTYAPWLDRLLAEDRRSTVDALVAVTDVYLWKVFRRDMGRSVGETHSLVRDLVGAVLVRAETIVRGEKQ